MPTAQIETTLLHEVARHLRGYANVLDVSAPPNGHQSDKINEIKEVARQVELAIARNPGRSK